MRINQSIGIRPRPALASEQPTTPEAEQRMGRIAPRLSETVSESGRRCAYVECRGKSGVPLEGVQSKCQKRAVFSHE
jgi:hypothetical protein